MVNNVKLMRVATDANHGEAIREDSQIFLRSVPYNSLTTSSHHNLEVDDHFHILNVLYVHMYGRTFRAFPSHSLLLSNM